MFGSLFVILGEHNLNGNSENAKPIFRAVRRMIIHRQYNAATFENDLALLELSAPIQDEPNVMPICLPNRESDVFDEATVTGFGKLKYGNELLWPLCALYEHQFKCSLSLSQHEKGGSIPSILQVARLPILDNKKCQEMYLESGVVKKIRDTFLCAGKYFHCSESGSRTRIVEREPLKKSL